MGWNKFNSKWLIAISIILVVVFANSFLPGNSEGFDLPPKVDFNYDIRPILSQNCYVCHGPDSSSRKANLRLDNREGATAMLEEGGAAIVPGKPTKSLLIERISSTDPDYRMPPPEAKKILSQREIALFRKWIRQGAEWKPHWAFIKPMFPKLPSALHGAAPPDVIDYLIDKKREINKLTTSPSAPPYALIRRVSYLLTGLPPDPEDLQVFVSDTSANSYKKMVDYYLSSPHFGERWARHWMDLVRYGEHMGHEFDFPISGAWQYRDYLIRAFNQDVPYDLFVKEHLAGDMLAHPRYHPKEEFNESIIGTAYFFLGEGKHSPVSVKLEEADRIDNMIDVTTKTFQGLTVSCARCHDHKFDPIPTTDYYGLYGMIASARVGPQPAKKTLTQERSIQRMKEIKREVRKHMAAQLSLLADQASPVKIDEPKRNLQSPTALLFPKPDSLNYQVIGDFRQGSWKGWYADGWAFGDAPLLGEPVFDRQTYQFKHISSGFASSQSFATGVQGALRSPNFIIKHDSLAVRAVGDSSTIRIVADNFQVIRYPLYGSLEKIIDAPEWKTYTFDLTLVKGSKAYVEILPGYYDWHAYHILPQHYIDIEYVVAFDSVPPDMKLPAPDQQPEFSLAEKKNIIREWMNGQAGWDKIPYLNEWLQTIGDKHDSNALPQLIKEYDSLATLLYDPDHVLGMTEGDPVFSPVFHRGSIDQLGKEKIPHQFLSTLSAGLDSFPQQGSGRLAWAEAVVDPANPLAARVIVNRIWHHLFGRGIVETVDNFGMQGKLPSHPELLDYLSLRFMEDGWSMKGLIKDIVLSQSFRRSTESLKRNESLDPDNYFLHHFPVRRLEAEAIRDGILAVSGCLDKTMYGEPIPVHLTEFMNGPGRPKLSGPLDGAGRRNIYQAINRNFLAPMMLVFDMPIPFSTFGRRNTTNVPAQSLALLNDPFVHEQAEYWAEDILRKGTLSISERIQEVYIRAFSRLASPVEVEESLTLLEELAREYECSLPDMQEDAQLWTDYCHTIFNAKEFIHLM